MSSSNTSVYLTSYVLGEALRQEHFELREAALRPLADGKVLLETLSLSVDPYLRGCMTGMPNYYLPQLDLRAPIHSPGVARVPIGDPRAGSAGARAGKTVVLLDQ